eukprot:TRINITY_DN51766_c0_g1_i1.p1 TRINITY_DN51766_c0_g1~~TRINITY_DN51766_c0_g1_i1.p1  ORF type:complete len:690 (+),score=74.24 TRINITY_DN51766_c0_g1_i1:50-2119(+)
MISSVWHLLHFCYLFGVVSASSWIQISPPAQFPAWNLRSIAYSPKIGYLVLGIEQRSSAEPFWIWQTWDFQTWQPSYTNNINTPNSLFVGLNDSIIANVATGYKITYDGKQWQDLKTPKEFMRLISGAPRVPYLLATTTSFDEPLGCYFTTDNIHWGTCGTMKSNPESDFFFTGKRFIMIRQPPTTKDAAGKMNYTVSALDLTTRPPTWHNIGELHTAIGSIAEVQTKTHRGFLFTTDLPGLPLDNTAIDWIGLTAEGKIEGKPEFIINSTAVVGDGSSGIMDLSCFNLMPSDHSQCYTAYRFPGWNYANILYSATPWDKKSWSLTKLHDEVGFVAGDYHTNTMWFVGNAGSVMYTNVSADAHSKQVKVHYKYQGVNGGAFGPYVVDSKMFMPSMDGQLYTSTDDGKSWQTTYSHTMNYVARSSQPSTHFVGTNGSNVFLTDDFASIQVLPNPGPHFNAFAYIRYVARLKDVVATIWCSDWVETDEADWVIYIYDVSKPHMGWAKVFTFKGTEGAMFQIVATDSYFIASGNRGVWTSPDGKNWKRIWNDIAKGTMQISRPVYGGGMTMMCFHSDGSWLAKVTEHNITRTSLPLPSNQLGGCPFCWEYNQERKQFFIYNLPNVFGTTDFQKYTSITDVPSLFQYAEGQGYPSMAIAPKSGDGVLVIGNDVVAGPADIWRVPEGALPPLNS